MSNRSKAHDFRNEVILALQAAGLPTAAPPTPARSTTGAPAGYTAAVDSLPGWTVTTKSPERAYNLSEAVRQAATLAQRNGHDRYAAVVRRHGFPVTDAYVVMPLSLLVEVIKHELDEPTVTDERRSA